MSKTSTKARLATVCLFLAVCTAASANEDSVCPSVESSVSGSVTTGHEVRFIRRIGNINRQLQSRRQYDTVLLGDSIFQRWPREMLSLAVGNEVLNAAIGGDDVSSLLFRLAEKTVQANVDGQNETIGLMGWKRLTPKNVVILIGTNDFARKRPPCEIFSGILQIVKTVRTMYPSSTVTVVGVLPRGEHADQFTNEIAELNSSLKRSAPEKEFKFLDINRLFTCDKTDGCGLTKPPNYVHPTSAGYEIIGKALKAHLSK